MKRNVVVGAWLVVVILSAWSCAEVIGLPDGEVVMQNVPDLRSSA